MKKRIKIEMFVHSKYNVQKDFKDTILQMSSKPIFMQKIPYIFIKC